MSWFWGSSGGKDDKDATSNLDPSLRDFLDKQSAQQQSSSKQDASRQAPSSASSDTHKDYRSQLGLDEPGLNLMKQQKPPQAEDTNAKPTVPSESQFQDGRYAHLWKTYRSQEELAAATYTDQDKMSAVLGNFKDRRAAIGRAAIENCAFEQMEQSECFRSGSYSRLATLCRAEGRAFNRCYEMQARFLKALGYLSVPRSDAEEERIQMHADKLYQDMMRREKQAQEAKERGVDLPPAAPLIQADETLSVLGQESAWARMRAIALSQDDKLSLDSLAPQARAKLMEKVKTMSDDAKAIELQLVAAEVRVGRDLAQQIMMLQDEQREGMRIRREEGRETFGDKLRRWGGYKS